MMQELELLRLRLRDRRFWRSLPGRVALIALVSLAAAWIVPPLLRRAGSPLDRAAWLARSGERGRAESIYWNELAKPAPKLPTVIAFLDNHATLVAWESLEPFRAGGRFSWSRPKGIVVAPKEIDAFFDRSDLDAGVARLGRFWHLHLTERTAERDVEEIEAEADREPPLPWTNHLLARLAEENDDFLEAARRFEREGLAFSPESRKNLRRALHHLERLEKWDEIDRRMADPRFARAIDADLRFHRALVRHDYFAALRWFLPARFEGTAAGAISLAALAAALWFLLAAELGRVRDQLATRLPLYLGAFGLGLFAPLPTLAISQVTEAAGFVETGEPARDLVYFIFGVGLREELSKLLLFLPLLPLLRRWARKASSTSAFASLGRPGANRLEVLAAGALVGLGFAALENVAYFHAGDLSTALGRFLTANFLHMALTALLAEATVGLIQDPNAGSDHFTRILLLVVGLHGLYDFFLSNPIVSEWSFLAMTIFVVLASGFLRQMRSLRPSGGEWIPLRDLFVLSIASLAGASYVWASWVVGPNLGARAIATGLLGSVILVIMFVRELEGA